MMPFVFEIASKDAIKGQEILRRPILIDYEESINIEGEIGNEFGFII